MDDVPVGSIHTKEEQKCFQCKKRLPKANDAECRIDHADALLEL